MDKKILHVIYRISDKGNPKPKLSNGGKWACLFNAVNEFGAENFHVIADNCTEETISALRATGLSFETTANGNAGTCRYIFDEVINRFAPEENLYLLEDDYLHLNGSREVLLEGLAIADYVTLYDHPDMYHPDGRGPNPFVQHTHWRSTVSTTFTFAAKVQTLLEDRDVWKKFSAGKIPAAFFAFIILTGQDDLNEAKRFAKFGWDGLSKIIVENFLSGRKKRLLISPLPAFSTHTETNYLSPLIDWSRV